MNRRDFFSTIAVAAAASAAPPVPIIDTHIHLFDPNRKEGVPWPPKSDVIYKPALPARYRKLAQPLGIVGAIEVEASPLLEDNQWILDTAAGDTMIIGTVGDIEAGKPEFARSLERFHKNPMFLGIRCGNIWDRDLVVDVKRPAFISDLKLLAAAGLTLDTANQTPAMLEAAVRVTDQIPNLRVVIDHLPQSLGEAHLPHLRELSKRHQVFFKVSEVHRTVDGKVPADLAFYRDRLDQMWDLIGADRLMFGSDWPNSDHWTDIAAVVGLVRPYFAAKGRAVEEKVFGKNSIAAYKWKPRHKSQHV
ncbi:MAG: amidohydrolase family protein [Bryobacteraceae bacterium]